jgi:hypothetical protein
MVLKIERFQPEGMNIRMSGGKPSYSHVVTVSGSGKIVYTAQGRHLTPPEGGSRFRRLSWS